jgi:hypothetical protein
MVLNAKLSHSRECPARPPASVSTERERERTEANLDAGLMTWQIVEQFVRAPRSAPRAPVRGAPGAMALLMRYTWARLAAATLPAAKARTRATQLRPAGAAPRAAAARSAPHACITRAPHQRAACLAALSTTPAASPAS